MGLGPGPHTTGSGGRGPCARCSEAVEQPSCARVDLGSDAATARPHQGQQLICSAICCGLECTQFCADAAFFLPGI